MRVLNGENSRHTLFGFITNKKNDYHISDMEPFIFNADLVDPVDVARRDYMEFPYNPTFLHFTKFCICVRNFKKKRGACTSSRTGAVSSFMIISA